MVYNVGSSFNIESLSLYLEVCHDRREEGVSQDSYQEARGLWGPARNKVCRVLKVHRRAWLKDSGPLRERTLGPGPAIYGPGIYYRIPQYYEMKPEWKSNILT